MANIDWKPIAPAASAGTAAAVEAKHPIELVAAPGLADAAVQVQIQIATTDRQNALAIVTWNL